MNDETEEIYDAVYASVYADEYDERTKEINNDNDDEDYKEKEYFAHVEADQLARDAAEEAVTRAAL